MRKTCERRTFVSDHDKFHCYASSVTNRDLNHRFSWEGSTLFENSLLSIKYHTAY